MRYRKPPSNYAMSDYLKTSRSHRNVRIGSVFVHGKKWIKATMKDRAVSFEDIYRLLRALCECEIEKYGPGAEQMVRDFVSDCTVAKYQWGDLVAKYAIPYPCLRCDRRSKVGKDLLCSACRGWL